MGLSPSMVAIIILVICIAKAQARGQEFDVRQFGAVADGRSDNSKAFYNAWTMACGAVGHSVVMVPKGTFVVGSAVFEGPCRATSIDFVVRGVVKATSGRYSGPDKKSWLTFQYVDGLTLSGGGTFDGQGASVWRLNDCSKNQNCFNLPVSLVFNFVTNSYVNHISSLNSKGFHMHVFRCTNVWFDSLTIRAPSTSPNTDGLHIAVSDTVRVTNSKIGTGDDCISIGPGTTRLTISQILCGPGHGISIGSLGKTPNEAPVSSVSVTNCTFTRTTNGLRIKTWAPSAPGIVRDLAFEDIFIKNSANPIVIDQHYCPNRVCDDKASSGVEISNVKFKNIWGFSSTKVAVDLQCSTTRPCRGLELRDINIRNIDTRLGGPATSLCANVKGLHYGVQIPPPCVN